MLTAVLLIAAQLAPLPAAPPADADADVLRALPKAASVPGVLEVWRDDVVIVKNRLKAGEGHWECVAYYTETVQLAFPFPVQVKKSRATAVYLDTQRARLGGK